MKATIEEKSSTETKINIEIPEETVQSKLDQKYSEISKTAKIHGFRKGKVPKSVVVQKYQANVTSEVLNQLIPETISTAIKENKLRPVSQPIVDNILLEKGKPLSFDATVEVIPKLKLKEFSETELSCEIVKVSDKDVDSVINRIQESLAVFESSGEKEIAEGDYVLFDQKCEADGKDVPKLTEPGRAFIVGKRLFFEEIEKGVIGMKSGETKEIPVTFPENFHMKGLAGASSLFTITIKEVKHRKLPELDDEFAKHAGKGKTLDEMRTLILGDLEKGAKNNARMQAKQQLLERLVKENPVEIPEMLKKTETERLLSGHERQGQTDRDSQTETPDELRKKMEEQATYMLSKEMIIDSFTEEHSIALTEDELSSEIHRLAERLGETPEVFSRKMKENPRAFANFEQRILNEKTLDAMLDTIKLSEVYVDPKVKESGAVT
ncbi:MAG: trigger factor [Nitrospinota bacterium]